MSQIVNKFLAQVPAHTLKGNSSGSTANVADLTVSQVNTMLGTILANGSVAFSANQPMGGNILTGLGAGTAAGNSVRYEQAILVNGVNAWTANQDLGGFVITGSGTAVNPNDLVSKSYVDNFINATSWKNAVLVATTANITLSGEQTIDGFLTNASRVLVKNQTTPKDNGIYVSAAGAWTRAVDMSTWAEVPAAATFVQEGTVNADIGYVCTSQPGGTLGTTAISFVQFSTAGAYTADGVTLQLVGGQFSIKNGGVSNTQVSATAGIVYSKLSLTGSIVNADIATGAAIAYTKLNLSASVRASDMNSQAATSNQVLTADGAGGASYLTPPAAAIATEQHPTLSSGDITNQYYDLSFMALGSSAAVNSISLDVYGGPEQLKGVDYTVSLTGGSGGVTRITFAGDLATGGNAALVAGDIIMIKYEH